MSESSNESHPEENVDIPEIVMANTPSDNQQLFLRYFFAILIDLVVLNLFAEFWQHVTIESFSISLLAAILLQVLLKLTLKVEHHVGLYFKSKQGMAAKFLRFLAAWFVLFSSKFVILFAIEFSFGDAVHFGGPYHGVVVFIVVVVAVLAAEEIMARLYRSLK